MAQDLRYGRSEGVMRVRWSKCAAAAVLASASLIGPLLVGNTAPAFAGTPVPGAGGCPMFPADNVWNTDISATPGRPPQLPRGWPAWTAPPPTCTRTSGPRGTRRSPTGSPTPWCRPRTRSSPVTFHYASESDPGPYPFGADTPIEGGSQSTGDRHALMVDPTTCTLYELYDAHYSASGSTAGSGAIWNLRSERPPARRLDLGGRGRPADPPGAPALRRGAVGHRSPMPSA